MTNTSPVSDAWRGSGLAPKAGSGWGWTVTERQIQKADSGITSLTSGVPLPGVGRGRHGETAREMDRQTFYDGSKVPRGKATQALTADHATKLR